MKGSTVNLRWQKKESVNLKIDQNKVSNLQNREKKEEVSQIAFLANNPNMVQINVFGTKVTQSQANKCLDQSIIVNYDPT